MKLKHLIAAGTAATITYLAVQNRKKIAHETTEAMDSVRRIQESYQTIQDQLAFIQSYQQPLQEMARDLQYKLRVYQQAIAGNLNEIQKIQVTEQEK
ncbi:MULTISPECIES: chemotaxis protein [unclassified Streptococcus]|uniref:chemotaxis protein n=1 Tax=unclassified Streptococcus TaxID=2608887 RepID=UPI0010723590|nr:MULTISPECIES: chemotaxis protein [unclassified Streptococcus]MBF0787689.1 chemotaxis protein [Streptococcus sp. 19428wC2_LYSM12]MCQ9211240.1 chemotaxis protein [Streptococcus sp. B01]MCQ9214553.1 chemotaxis protein [Streptococcus sp. O1]TFV05298.1 chemotaxis protein [Streptococcus sp. LYSM12]